MTMNFCIKLEGSDILENFPHFCCSRSRRRWYSGRNGVLRNFAKFTGKHLCQSLFLNKSTGQSAALLKKKILTQVFSYEFCKILNTPKRLLLLFPFSSREIAKRQNRPDFHVFGNQIFYFLSQYLRNELEKQNFWTKFLRLLENISEVI